MVSRGSNGRPNHDRGARRRRWIIVGLSVFVLFDFVLVAFALTEAKPSDLAGTVVESVETQPPSVKTTTPVVEPVETQAPLVESVPPNRVLAALSESTAWRSGTGSCPTARATPELTTDAGATWTGFDASIETGASSVLAITAISASEASMVTLAAANCAPQLVATFVAGEQWKDFPDRLNGNWYIDPANRGTLHSPSGSLLAPCPTANALASRSDTIGGVLCADGTLVRTSDGGATWGPGIAFPGAVNLAATPDGYILAAANQPGCGGVQLLSTPEALDGAITLVGCREAVFNPGDVAIASAGRIVWLWAGNIMSRSSDGGATWQ